jgi:hypothetical protein
LTLIRVVEPPPTPEFTCVGRPRHMESRAFALLTLRGAGLKGLRYMTTQVRAGLGVTAGG